MTASMSPWAALLPPCAYTPDGLETITDVLVALSDGAPVPQRAAEHLAQALRPCLTGDNDIAGRLGLRAPRRGGAHEAPAALAREQREGQAIKNAVARKEFAPVGLLADVLGMAASAVVDRFDQLEGALRKACPDLPDDAKTTVQSVIAAARNEWIRSTERLVTEAIDAMLAAQDDDDTPELFDEDATA